MFVYTHDVIKFSHFLMKLRKKKFIKVLKKVLVDVIVVSFLHFKYTHY